MPHNVSLSLWNELPQTVLAIAFKSLDFFSKLQVGSVCKSWGQVLQQTHASIWANSVVIHVYYDSIYAQFNTDRESEKLAVNQKKCFIAWLSRRIKGVCHLQLHQEFNPDCEDVPPLEPDFLRELLLCSPAPQLPKLSLDIDGMHCPVPILDSVA